MPNILSLKPGHDGNIALIQNEELKFLFEAEKDSYPRYSEITPTNIVNSFSFMNEIPDIVAISGWVKGFHSVEAKQEAGYYGTDSNLAIKKEINFLGKKINYFSSTHERSHIFCSYGLSPLRQGQPCYFLLWEGSLGNFYEIDEFLNINKLGTVMPEPGHKYAFLYSLADPTYKDVFRFESAGKLMALCAFSDRTPPTSDEKDLIDYIIKNVILKKTPKSDLKWSKFFDIGLESDAFRNIAGKLSDRIFKEFYEFAKLNCTKGYPLLIGGGCGLNCEWNTKWKETGLFPEVFVPPVTNDTGSALGTAIEAQFIYHGNAKIKWDVYAGEAFNYDTVELGDWIETDLNNELVSEFLKMDNIIAWIQGKCEIGPRALGNRSLIAAPFKAEIRDRLNFIKGREDYRPVAPICLLEEAESTFGWNGESPYMLYFQNVKTHQLKAVTHVDGTARIQTVTQKSNEKMYDLLNSFKKATGFGVLCNTSLNFNGKGFINSFSDVIKFSTEKQLDGFVINNKFYYTPSKNGLIEKIKGELQIATLS